MKKWIENNKITCGAILFGLFPLLCAVVWCLCEGHGIWDVYLPASYWNDELMYYKQIEAVINNGLPQGYFGYQEMHAEISGFAVWGPVVLIPWSVWGWLFGWNITSPIYANIAYNMIALLLFYMLVKPDKKQSTWILIFLSVFTPYTKFMLSGMAESINIALLIVFTGLSVAYTRRENKYTLLGMFGVVCFMTLYRPYVGILSIIPVFFCVKKYKWRGVIISGIILGITGCLYILISNYLCAPYLVQNVNVEWINIFSSEGIGEGIKYVVQTMTERVKILYRDYLKRALKWGLFSGSLYATTGLLTLLIAIRVILSRKDKEKSEYIKISIFYVLSAIGMIFAIFLFYQLNEGARHLMGFIVMGCFLLALIEKKSLLMKIIVVIACSYFFIAKIYAPYDWQVPYDDGYIKKEVMSIGAQLEKEMMLSEGEDPFENTVIWLSHDMAGEEVVDANWGLLYAIPKGFAINFCSPIYVMENFDEIKSRYIAAWPGGEVEERLAAEGYCCLVLSKNIAVYQNCRSAD